MEVRHTRVLELSSVVIIFIACAFNLENNQQIMALFRVNWVEQQLQKFHEDCADSRKPSARATKKC